jgi:putative ABC transport system permease protein
MTALRMLLSKVRALFGPPDRELHDEITEHLESLAAEHIKRGLTADVARAAARREFGGVEQIKEVYRDQRGLPGLDSLWQDVRFAARVLLKERGFTLAAISALALGIAANTTIFTVVNAALLRDLPFHDADSVVSVATHDIRTPYTFGPENYQGVSYPELRDWKSATRVFSDMATFVDTNMNVSGDDYAAERIHGAFVSSNIFQLLGRTPIAGRPFAASDDERGATRVTMIGYETWQRRYGGDPRAIGRTIRVNGVPTVVIGVMPAGFQFPSNSDIWIPLTANSALIAETRDTRPLDVIARLADGVDISSADAELDIIAANLARDYPRTNANIRTAIAPFNNRFVAPRLRIVFVALMGAVALVLLIACANVANLLLARSATRAAEVSIRMSLGATRARIVRQLLVESLLLAVMAGIAGFGMSLLGLRLFRTIVQAFGAPPFWIQFTMDMRVFAFLAAVCLGTGVLFGLVPALHASRADVNTAIKDRRSGTESRNARLWIGVLVTGQLALTLTLLSSAGYFGRAFLDEYRLDVGFDTSPLIRMWLELRGERYGTPEKRAAFAEALDSRLASVPQMSASLTSRGPLAAGDPYDLSIDGQPDSGHPRRRVSMQTVGPRYFDTLGLHLTRGRAFTIIDGGPGQEAAIVNERFAAKYFPDRNPLRARIRIARADIKDVTPTPWLTIIGVAPALYQRDTRAPDAVVYLPYRAQALHYVNVQVIVRRHAGTTEAAVKRVNDELRALDPDLPVFDAGTFDQWLAFQRSPQRVFGTLFSIFAGMALLLAGIGLYAIVSHSVTQRAKEIGIRMALGARRGDVQWLVMRRCLIHVGGGLALGLAGAFGAGKVLDGVLGAHGSDVPVIGIVTGILVAAAAWACVWPMRRATRIHPIEALRYE